MAKPARFSPFDEIILKSWWVILLFLIIFFAYDRTTYRLGKEERRLTEKRERLLKERVVALERQEELLAIHASARDGGWIELVLMQRLGLVPEGATKVIFTSPKNSPTSSP